MSINLILLLSFTIITYFSMKSVDKKVRRTKRTIKKIKKEFHKICESFFISIVLLILFKVFIF